MVTSLVLLGGAGWFFWKFLSSKNLRHFYIAIFLITFILSQWPLFFPMKFVFSIDAWIAAAFLIYENALKGIKNSSSMTYIYVLLFILFGILFFGEAWLEVKKQFNIEHLQRQHS
jgi:hypothetical protein